MENNNKSTNMSIRIEKELKKEADALFRELGLNTSVAINMFLKQCVRNQSIPFTPSKNNDNNQNNGELSNGRGF